MKYWKFLRIDYNNLNSKLYTQMPSAEEKERRTKIKEAEMAMFEEAKEEVGKAKKEVSDVLSKKKAAEKSVKELKQKTREAEKTLYDLQRQREHMQGLMKRFQLPESKDAHEKTAHFDKMMQKLKRDVVDDEDGIRVARQKVNILTGELSRKQAKLRLKSGYMEALKSSYNLQ